MVENLRSNNHTWITDDKLVTISSCSQLAEISAKSPATEIKFLLLLLTNLF